MILKKFDNKGPEEIGLIAPTLSQILKLENPRIFNRNVFDEMSRSEQNVYCFAEDILIPFPIKIYSWNYI